MSNQENQWKRDLLQAQNTQKQNPNSQKETEEPMAPEIPEPELPKEPKESEGIKKGIAEKIRKLTATALRSSLSQIIATFGLAFWGWLYVGFHYVMSYLSGPLASLFPRPGREWVKLIVDRMPVPEKSKKWAEETIGPIIEIFELMFTCTCCSSCLVVILTVLFIIWVVTSPCNIIELVFGRGWIYSIFCRGE